MEYVFQVLTKSGIPVTRVTVNALSEVIAKGNALSELHFRGYKNLWRYTLKLILK